MLLAGEMRVSGGMRMGVLGGRLFSVLDLTMVSLFLSASLLPSVPLLLLSLTLSVSPSTSVVVLLSISSSLMFSVSLSAFS